MWVGLIQPTEQKVWVGGNSSCLTAELRHKSLPAFRHKLKNQFFLGLEPPGFWTGPSHQLSWLSGLQLGLETHSGALLGFQLTNCRSWDFSDSVIAWVSSLSSIPLSIISYWFCFSEELWVVQSVRRKLLFPEPVDNRNWAGCSIFITHPSHVTALWGGV